MDLRSLFHLNHSVVYTVVLSCILLANELAGHALFGAYVSRVLCRRPLTVMIMSVLHFWQVVFILPSALGEPLINCPQLGQNHDIMFQLSCFAGI